MWLLFLIILAHNDPILSFQATAKQSHNDIEVISSTRNEVEFVYTPPKLLLKPFPYIPNTYPQQEVGKPNLPIKYVAMGIPVGAKFDVNVIEAISIELTDVYIPPTKGFTEGEEDKEIYNRDGFWPYELVAIKERKFCREQEVLTIRINPLRYNPKRKVLLFYKKIRIKVNFYGGTGVPQRDKIFENVFKNELINYEQAKNWRKKMEVKHFKYRLGPWYKVELQDEGIYKITKEQLKGVGISLNTIEPYTIKLYNGGSKMCTDSLDTLREVPIYVLPDTSILFYGTSLSGWDKNVRDKLFYNPYTNTNVYWLTYGGTTGRRDSISGSIINPNPEIPEYFIDTLHVEEDLLCPSKSGLQFVWEKLERAKENSSFKRDYIFNAHGQKVDSCTVRVAVYGWYSDKTGADINLLHNIRLYLNGVSFFETSWTGGDQDPPKIYEEHATGLDGVNTFTLEMYKGASQKNDIIFFNWFEVIYKRKYKAYNESLKFKGKGANLEFRVQNFHKLPVIFNITNPIEPKFVYGAVFENGIVKFQCLEGVYYASNEFKTPRLKVESPYNLRNEVANIDFIIITHPDFFDYANKLKRYREGQGCQTKVFSIFDIYNNFSWGLMNSPYAIRNFLKFAYENQGQPGYCLLLGAGTYDYKGTLEKNRIPPFETGYCVGEYGYPPSGNDCSDFLYVDGKFAIGRITVKSKDEARDAIEKLIKYEKNTGVWQNRILLIADDGAWPEQPDAGFIIHEEGLANEIPKGVDIFKVYLTNYPLIGGLKRKATGDLIRYITNGVFMTFFAGHGNLMQLCHEQLFLNPQDIYPLNNGTKLPISYFWSCGVGCFDRQYEDGMADFMQKIKDKGSIATEASTRAEGGPPGLDVAIIQRVLTQNASTVGEAIYGTSIPVSLPPNHNLFADPTTRLIDRAIDVTIDSCPDTLKGGKILKVSGHAPGANFAYITAMSSEYTVYGNIATYKMRGRMTSDSSQLTQDILFEGLTKVENGRWRQEFFIPVDIDSPMTGNRGKISVFAWSAGSGGNDAQCGSAGIETVVVTEGEPNPDDTVGPRIELFANGKPLRTGDLVPSEFTLSGVLDDLSGINIFNKIEPLHLALRLRFKDKDIPLADYFKYDIGSYTRGSFSYPVVLGKWDVKDTLYIQASDNLGNRNVECVIVNVVSAAQLSLTRVMNYPNPVKGEHTWFTFFLSKPARVNVKIYTVTGRLIKTIPAQDIMAGPSKIYWDTRDEIGNRVGNGIYIYKIEAVSEIFTREETAKISKLMVLR